MSKISKYEEILKFVLGNEDSIEEMIKDCFKQSFDSKYLGFGWFVDVEVDKDESWIGGVRQYNTQSQSSFNGDSYVIFSSECKFDYDDDWDDDDDLYHWFLEQFNAYKMLQEGIKGLETVIEWEKQHIGG